jgi:hypothetical protein
MREGGMSKSRVEKLPLYIIEGGKVIEFEDQAALAKYAKIDQSRITKAMDNLTDPVFEVDGVIIYEIEPDSAREVVPDSVSNCWKRLWVDDGKRIREYKNISTYAREKGVAPSTIQKMISGAIEPVRYRGDLIYTKNPAKKPRPAPVKTREKGSTLLPGLCTHRLG